MSELTQIFMLGIGGMGMAPLAIYLAQSGCRVVGQDDKIRASMRQLLEQEGIEVVDTDSIPDEFTWVGYSSAIDAEHPLYQQAQARGATLMRRGELLAHVVQDKKLVAVIGSHGKTTTTGLLVQMLRAAHFNCGYVMGGLFKDEMLSPAVYAPQSDWVIAEIDESDGTIACFSPEYTLAVNFDWDHADLYTTPDTLVATFNALFARTASRVFAPESVVQTTGCHAQQFAESLEDFNQHNWNAAKALCMELTGVEPPLSIAEVVGIKRRQDVLLETDGITGLTVIADYAHHPTEINALLRWCLARFNGELIVVFQPHRYTRTQQFAPAFARELGVADQVLLLPVYAASEAYDEAGKADQIAAHGNPDWSLVRPSQCIQQLVAMLHQAKRRQVIVFIGAGDIEQVAHDFVADWVRVAPLSSQISGATRLTVQEPLAGKTTLRIGGNARYYAEPASREDLLILLRWAQEQSIAVFILGRGSNLIVLEDGFDGLVLRLNHGCWCAVEPLSEQRIRVGAGVRLKELCGQAAKHGLAGFEFLEGIPGTLGGALRMNAGAMGGWIFDVVESVEYVTLDGTWYEQSVADFTLGYRYCEELQTAVALAATLTVAAPKDTDAIRFKMETYASHRRESQPKEPSAGCIFKNPKDDYAGKLIEQCGLKGTRVGQAEVSQVHGNFIVNLGGATSDDVLCLVQEVRQRIFAQKGVWLQPEVLLLGSQWESVL